MKNFSIALLALILFTSCTKRQDFYTLPVWSPEENGYHLVWEDNFDSTAIDRTKWDYRAVGNTRGGAIVDSNTIYLDGEGHLVIELREKNGKFYVGQLSTMNKQLFKYGYFECNVMLNKQPGMIPAFWLQSPKISQGADPAVYGTEMDIFEYSAQDPLNIHTNIYWDYSNLKSASQKTFIPQIDSGYHKVGLKWTQEECIFYVDGRQIWQTSSAVSQMEEYIILSTEYYPGLWGGDANPQMLPDKVIFDYVKVYSK